MFPQRMRTYLTINMVLAIMMTVVMAFRTQLRTGRFVLIDIGLILFFSSLLACATVGPFALIELYLYRRKKGVWYQWKNVSGHSKRDFGLGPEEIQQHRSEAYRLRLSRAEVSPARHQNRTRLFDSDSQPEPVSRAALLMTVAEKLERSGKREAARRSFRQVIQRFPESPQAIEAARRLGSASHVD